MSNGDKCQQLTWVSKVNKEGFFFFGEKENRNIEKKRKEKKMN